MRQHTLFGERDGMSGGAEISPCGKYRYDLHRVWKGGDRHPLVNFVMLNPSTADADRDDPTIRRCLAFAKAWDGGSMVVTNLYAFRATDPKDLALAEDPIGPGNDDWIRAWAQTSQIVVLAWGAHGARDGRGDRVRAAIEGYRVRPHYLKRTASGQPCHPLYLPAHLVPIPWGQ